MILVSACLAGIKCRYDGTAKPSPRVLELIKKGQAVPVCPEQLGGLPTPRDPAEQLHGLILTKQGKDVTLQFKKGAEEGLKVAQQFNCTRAILKSKSPSCGCGLVYDGTFSGRLVKRDGVFAALLKKEGVEVESV